MGLVGRSGCMFEADLLGQKKEELKVEVEDDQVIHMSGRGELRRRIRTVLGTRQGAALVMASIKNGVLPVTIPKFEEKKS
ncbi:hypothetical protein CRG98_043384 [Punica granatum]|uniref:SHSP domain-containing protein n=1 Tax=Punica granatum TaxID=22663 RepID=A0A2I0HWZ6_PUNGR|nr:hypothetical protein CRG98_043384 [Punica granatum]